MFDFQNRFVPYINIYPLFMLDPEAISPLALNRCFANAEAPMKLTIKSWHESLNKNKVKIIPWRKQKKVRDTNQWQCLKKNNCRITFRTTSFSKHPFVNFMFVLVEVSFGPVFKIFSLANFLNVGSCPTLEHATWSKLIDSMVGFILDDSSGGWTNPFEKYARQIGNLPQGWKTSKSLKPPPSDRYRI